MLSNRFAFAALAAACVSAAGVGGYVASRQDAIEVAPQAAALSEESPTASTVEPLPEPPPAPVAIQARQVAAVPVKRAQSAPRRSPAAAPARVESPPEAANSPSQSVSPAPLAEDRTNTTDLDAVRTAPAIAESARPSAYQEPQLPAFRELVVPADSVVGVKLDTAISSETAKVEDRVEARVVREIRVNDMAAVPAGSQLIGSVVAVERGGKFRERATLGIRFDTLVLPDHTEVPISTETIYRYGNAPGNKTAAKIGGGAVAGAILGAIIGGSKGAAVGASTGAGAGTAVVMAGDRSEASFAAGTEVTARILSPVTVTLEE